METVLGDGQPLGFQGIVEFLDAEGRCRVAEQMALEPTLGDGIGNAVALDDVAQDSHIDVALQEWPPVANVDILGIGEASFS